MLLSRAKRTTDCGDESELVTGTAGGLATLRVGDSRSSFRLPSREVCVGAAGFVLSHTLTFGFMWDSVSAAVEALQPLSTDRFESLAAVVA